MVSYAIFPVSTPSPSGKNTPDRRRIPIKILGIVLAVLVSGMLLGGVVAAAIGVSFASVERVTFGETAIQQTDLDVLNVEVVGPGINVHAVDVTIENPTASPIGAEVSIYLMSGATVISDGSVTHTFGATSTETVTVDVDNIKEKDFDAIDLRVKET